MTSLVDLSAWIGKQERVTEAITPRVLKTFEATFAPFLARQPVPPGLHWCLGTPTAPSSALSEDGHPVKGGFLPPVPLPRRMWASGEQTLLDPLLPGDVVDRVSTVEDVAWKSGRSGELCFITVGHTYSTARGLAISEKQIIVYKPAAANPAEPTRASSERPKFDSEWRVRVDSVLLFRYSALTFNAHRIHYDLPYATGAERYPGLVIHGPLQATLMQNAATVHRGRQPTRFSFRSHSPAFGEQTLTVGVRETSAGADLAVLSEPGATVMTGEAWWD